MFWYKVDLNQIIKNGNIVLAGEQIVSSLTAVIIRFVNYINELTEMFNESKKNDKEIVKSFNKLYFN